MQHGRLENEECALLPDEDQDQDQCSDDHEHGTTRKVKTFRDPSVGLTPIFLLLFFLHDFAISGLSRVILSPGMIRSQ